MAKDYRQPKKEKKPQGCFKYGKEKYIAIGCKAPITNGHLLFVMDVLILEIVQKCKFRQMTKDVVKSEV